MGTLQCKFCPVFCPSKVSVIERSSWRDPLPTWGRSIISKGNFPQNSRSEQAGKIRSQCPFDILHLPHSGRGSQQLLLSRTDRSAPHIVNITPLNSNSCTFVPEEMPNECLSGNGGCSQICNNTQDSYQCGCIDGYSLNVDNHSCNRK